MQTAQEYIYDQLEALRASEPIVIKDSLVETIHARSTSKKFRKYALGDGEDVRILGAIQAAVAIGGPIQFGLPFGAYKLWRLDEAPEADWAEFFATMYYARWLRPICDEYAPGVVFRYCAQDMLAERLNNLTTGETTAYRESFMRVLSVVSTYLPENIRFEFVPLSSLYTREQFDTNLAQAVAVYNDAYPDVVYDEHKTAMTLLNTRPTDAQAMRGDAWVREVSMMHDASMKTLDMSLLRRYYRREDTICVFPTPIGVNSIGVGTTKSSIAKFWVGVGALQRGTADASGATEYRELVLSPSQKDTMAAEWEGVSLPGLTGKNFAQVRVVG